MAVGAMLAHASDPDISIIEEAAAAVGLAFQIQDDILDVTGTLETLGKPIGSDEKNAKTTYVTYEGIDKATEDVVRISEHAIAVLEGLGISDGFLSGLIRYLAGRDH
jgi:geranylgeranyl diphosphate synthase type II